MIDKKTKLLLLAIALGLWANVATQWLLPKELHAQSASLESDVHAIAGNVSVIAGGVCINHKIC